MNRRARAWLAVLLGLAACHEVTTNLVNDTEAPSTARDAAAALDATQASDSHVAARCVDHVCACDDGADDDDDGLIDRLDPECTGERDDDEETFAIGAPMGSDDCRDCYWDDNAGGGDDDCRYPTACLQGLAPNGKGNCSSCEVSATCIETCRAQTPSGCDCFGCCVVEDAGGDSHSVLLSDTCSHAKLDDELACPRCVQNADCLTP